MEGDNHSCSRAAGRCRINLHRVNISCDCYREGFCTWAQVAGDTCGSVVHSHRQTNTRCRPVSPYRCIRDVSCKGNLWCLKRFKCSNPVNTKYLYDICTMLDQRRRRWADVVQMLYTCFVFAGKTGRYELHQNNESPQFPWLHTWIWWMIYCYIIWFSHSCYWLLYAYNVKPGW